MTTELVRLSLGPGGDLVQVRTTVRAAARLLGLGGQDQTRLATAAAEIARALCAEGGGMLRVVVAAGADDVPVLSVELSPDMPHSSRPAEVDVLARLLDHFEASDGGWSMGKRLSERTPLTVAQLDTIRTALRGDRVVDPVVVLHEQNSELAATLVELRSREAELLRLNEELAETNRGVLALYAELERSADRVRRAQREVFTELEDALRPPPPAVRDLALAIRYLPAQSNSPTGGDLYDWLVLPDGLLHVSVVDVVGHGVASTRAALDVTHALRTLSREGRPLGEVTALADTLLAGTGALATVLLLRLDPRTGAGELAGAGHPPALLVPATGTVHYLEAPGRPLGFPGAGSQGTTRFQLGPADAVVLYTDGMIEAGPDIDEGLAALREAGERLRMKTLDEVLEGMLDTVRAAASLRDDALLLGVRRLAPGGTATG